MKIIEVWSWKTQESPNPLISNKQKTQNNNSSSKTWLYPQVKLPIVSRADDRSKLSGYLIHHDGLAKAWSWVSGVLLKGRWSQASSVLLPKGELEGTFWSCFLFSPEVHSVPTTQTQSKLFTRWGNVYLPRKWNVSILLIHSIWAQSCHKLKTSSSRQKRYIHLHQPNVTWWMNLRVKPIR